MDLKGGLVRSAKERDFKKELMCEQRREVGGGGQGAAEEWVWGGMGGFEALLSESFACLGKDFALETVVVRRF